MLVDSPGLTGKPDAEWVRQVGDADLVLWTVAANRANGAVDEIALKELRALSLNDHHRRAVPVVLVLTHADRLDPPLEWQPPYEPAGDRPKERTMRAALEAIRRHLDVSDDRSVIVSVAADGSRPWNINRLWLRIADAVPAAKQMQFNRGLRPGGWWETLADLPPTLVGVTRQIMKRVSG